MTPTSSHQEYEPSHQVLELFSTLNLRGDDSSRTDAVQVSQISLYNYNPPSARAYFHLRRQDEPEADVDPQAKGQARI